MEEERVCDALDSHRLAGILSKENSVTSADEKGNDSREALSVPQACSQETGPKATRFIPGERQP